jgi:hypothetical protein
MPWAKTGKKKSISSQVNHVIMYDDLALSNMLVFSSSSKSVTFMLFNKRNNKRIYLLMIAIN